jgi:hypothetical protein
MMNSTDNNLSVATSTPVSGARVCVVFSSEEKENLRASDFRTMGCVEVIDGDKRRGGAAFSESFTTFTERLEKRFAAQDEKIKTQDVKIANLTDRSNEIARLLDDAARGHNDLQGTINDQQVNINALLQHNEDLSIDRTLLDELSRYRNREVIDELSRDRYRALLDDFSIYREWAMCSNCNQERRRDNICLPCRHTFCADCLDDRDHCPVCLTEIVHRHTLL